MEAVSIFDTTLRDGEQAPGNSMNFEQKIEIFTVIDALGVDLIEVGFPSANKVDFNVTKEIAKRKNNAKICAFARSNKHDIDTALEALKYANNFQIQTLAVGSEIHLEHKRKIDSATAIQEAVEAINYLSSNGIQDISLGVEDASRGSMEYLKRLINASVEAGATTIVISDTVGCSIPKYFGKLVSEIKQYLGSSIKLSVHCHNDMGLALANTLEALRKGADEVQTTLCGIGERAGNTSLEELIAVLLYNSDFYNYSTNIISEKLYNSCKSLIDTINIPISNSKPIIGKNVFATEAGIHQQGMLNNPITYEHVEPNKFGRERELLFGSHSGRSFIKSVIEKEGLEVDKGLIDSLYNEVMESGNFDEFNDSKKFKELYLRLQSQIKE